MRSLLAVTGVFVAAVAASGAGAEPEKPKPTLSAYGLFGPLPLDFDETRSVDLYLEKGSLETAYSARARPGFEIGLQYPLGRRLSLMATGGIAQRNTKAAYSASLPHPLYLAANRTAVGELNDLAYSESSGHLGLGYGGRAGAFTYTLFAGPSVYRVKSQLIDRVEPREKYPYDEVTLDLPTTNPSKVAAGVHLGGALAYPVASNLALGLQARYGLAKVRLEPKAGETTELTAGGPQVALGLRFSF